MRKKDGLFAAVSGPCVKQASCATKSSVREILPGSLRGHHHASARPLTTSGCLPNMGSGRPRSTAVRRSVALNWKGPKKFVHKVHRKRHVAMPSKTAIHKQSQETHIHKGMRAALCRFLHLTKCQQLRNADSSIKPSMPVPLGAACACYHHHHRGERPCLWAEVFAWVV